MFGDAPLPVILAAGAVGLALPVLFWGLAGLGRRGAKPSTLAAGDEERRVVDEHLLRLQEPATQRIVRPVLRSLAQRARRLTPAGWVASLERRVRFAGSPPRWTVERVLAVKLLFGIATLLVGVMWIAGQSSSNSLLLTLGRIVMVPALALGAYMFPDLLLAMAGRDRQRVIQNVLPDALDQMSICVEAGLGFDSALQRLVDSGQGPLIEELRRTIREIAIGASRRQAFRNLVERTDVPELRHFVFAVNQAEEYGLPIANVLRVQSRELRVIRRQRAEEAAQKLPVKMVFPLITCIFPPLFVVVLVPAAIRIADLFFK